MATVILKKLYKNARGEYKAGEKISVPFGEGVTIVADGTGEYPKASQPAASVPNVAEKTAAERYAEQVGRIRDEHGRQQKSVRDECNETIEKLKTEHLKETTKLKADLDAAEKLVIEANKKK